jgi:hypothetical protein
MEISPSENKYDLVVPTLLKEGEGFGMSPEYKALAGTAGDLPGVVASAYASFVQRRAASEKSKEASQAIMAPLNKLATWNDPQVNQMLQDEVFVRLEDDGGAYLVEPAMNDDLHRLYETWKQHES